MRAYRHLVDSTQAWLQASTIQLLHGQLFRVFQTHRPHVVRGHESDLASALARITQWLATDDEWLFVVEDVCEAAVLEVFPQRGRGRLLVTSQQPLHTAGEGGKMYSHEQRVEPIRTHESLQLIRSLDVFAHKDVATYITQLHAHDPGTFEQLCRAAEIVPSVVLDDSTGNGKARARAMAALYTHEQLSRPEFATFVETELGNLPLSVSVCAQLLRMETSVDDAVGCLMAQFRTLDMSHLQAKSRMRVGDKHYVGLAISVRLLLQRWRTRHDTGELRETSESVLFVVSLLHNTHTPAGLLSGHDGQQLRAGFAGTIRAHTETVGRCRQYRHDGVAVGAV
eukprot:m.1001723 g.1001723  ORF g.1001723 m.1001723 type:complete len:339 (+) comp24033_c0_seq6:566-1582(+)